MRRLAILATAIVLVLAIAGQIVAPRIAANRVRDRLTRGGGSAEVHIGAFPWPRLLFSEGDSVKVRGSGLALALVTASTNVFGALDGFDDVDVQITDARAGPLRIGRFTLTRSGGDSAYDTTVTGTITARDLAAFTAGQAGGIVGGFLGGIAGALPFGDQPLPVDLSAVLRSDGGRARAVTVSGSVAGLPAGPLVEALAVALAGRF